MRVEYIPPPRQTGIYNIIGLSAGDYAHLMNALFARSAANLMDGRDVNICLGKQQRDLWQRLVDSEKEPDA